MVYNISQYIDCANCGACYNICPVQAIHVKTGLFYSVEVDQSKCLHCGKCLNVCPVNHAESRQSISGAYSVIHTKREIVMRSSSGGAFTAFAEQILSQGGVVWGACFSETCETVLFKSTQEVTLDSLRRSKYVESLVGDSFQRIRTLLNDGICVLFCGTPCQVAGLKRYLGNDTGNLYTCDFACGGLPSHQIYQEWLHNLERRFSSNAVVVNFRPKIYGWKTYCIRVCFANRKIYRMPAFLDPYFSAFVYKQYSIRDYCTKCQFSNNHYSDLILADFWLHKQFQLKNNQSHGISLVLVNSARGQQLLNACKERFSIEELSIHQASYNIKPRSISHNKLSERASFLKSVAQDGTLLALKKHCLPDAKTSLIYRIKLTIKQFLGWNQ